MTAQGISSGFSRWSFSFNLTQGRGFGDTIELQPMERQFRPTIARFVRLKLTLHRLKPDGISEAALTC